MRSSPHHVEPQVQADRLVFFSLFFQLYLIHLQEHLSPFWIKWLLLFSHPFHSDTLLHSPHLYIQKYQRAYLYPGYGTACTAPVQSVSALHLPDHSHDNPAAFLP